MERPIIAGDKTAVQTSRVPNSPGSLSDLGDVTKLLGSATLVDDLAPEFTAFVVMVGIPFARTIIVSEVQDE